MRRRPRAGADRPTGRIVACATTAAVLAACLVPGRYLKALEGGPPGRVPIDKAIHVALFAGLAASWRRAHVGGGSTAVILAVGAALAVGTELVQGLPGVGRDPEALDAAADLVGLLLGAAMPCAATGRGPVMRAGRGR